MDPPDRATAPAASDLARTGRDTTVGPHAELEDLPAAMIQSPGPSHGRPVPHATPPLSMNSWLVPVPLPAVTELASEPQAEPQAAPQSPALLSPTQSWQEDRAVESIEQPVESQPALPGPGLRDPLFAAPPRPASQG